jgi:hypothetical protein
LAKLDLNVNICIGPDCLLVGYNIESKLNYTFKSGYASQFGISQDFNFILDSNINLQNENGCDSSHSALTDICMYYANIFQNEKVDKV